MQPFKTDNAQHVTSSAPPLHKGQKLQRNNKKSSPTLPLGGLHGQASASGLYSRALRCAELSRPAAETRLAAQADPTCLN